MLGVGWTEMLVIGVVALIVIGPKDLPVVMRRLGKVVGTIRRMGSEFQREINKTTGLDQITDLRRSITEPLKKTADEITREFNKPMTAPASVAAVGRRSSRPRSRGSRKRGRRNPRQGRHERPPVRSPRAGAARQTQVSRKPGAGRSHRAGGQAEAAQAARQEGGQSRRVKAKTARAAAAADAGRPLGERRPPAGAQKAAAPRKPRGRNARPERKLADTAQLAGRPRPTRTNSRAAKRRCSII